MTSIKTLFVGLGNSRVAWYRAVLPAMYLGADFMGVVGAPPNLQACSSYVQGRTQVANFADYDVIVVQQPRGRGWFEMINKLREAGKVVLVEYDDYVHGIRNSKDHDFKEFFQKDALKSMELCMRAADGMICSTGYIARRYAAFTPRTWVAENGLDMGRYRLTRPPRGSINGRETVTIMWSGATGHARGTAPWLDVVDRVMEKYPHVCFASIGQAFGGRFQEKYGERVISVPFAALETYPAAMMLGDIALAPAGRSSWYAAKSHLRVMEAAALGIPVVADRHYSESVLPTTGYIVSDPGEVEIALGSLIEDMPGRNAMGVAAREHAETFDMTVRRGGWHDALINAYEECHA